MAPMSDPVNHPAHYHSSYIHESCGTPIECIDVVRHMGFDEGNAVKYIWRAGKKGDEVEDLEKAIWYLQDRVSELKRARQKAEHAESELVEKPIQAAVKFPSSLLPMATWEECTVHFPDDDVYKLMILDAGSASSAWYVWNHNSFYRGLSIDERQRGRDEILGLISKLPPAEFGKLSEHIQETVSDWIQAQGMKGEGNL
jgi:hypothetical protein